VGLLPIAAARSTRSGETFEVRVEDEDGDPVRGVRVVAVRAAEAEFWQWMIEGLPAEDWPVSEGKGFPSDKVRKKTNSKGLVQFPEECGRHWIVVSKKHRKGHAHRLLACGRLPERLDAVREPLVLVLREPSPLQVHVADAGGRSMVGARVEVAKAGGMERKGTAARHALVTDALGLAVFPEASAWLPPLLEGRGTVCLQWVSPTEAVVFDPEQLGEAAIELVAPAGRDVDVRFLDQEGELLSRVPAFFSMVPMDLSKLWTQVSCVFEDGEVHLRNVPLNQEFIASGTPLFGDLKGEVRFMVTEPGAEPMTLDIQLPEPTWTFSGKLVDDKGHVVASEDVRVGFGLLGNQLHTDARGRFEILFGSGWGLPGTEMGCLWFSLGDLFGRSRPIGADQKDGVVDLGKIRLGEPDVLCAGVVRSPDGKRISGARIQLYGERENGVDLVDLPIAAAVSDGRGRFEVRSLPLETEVFIVLSHELLVPTSGKYVFEAGDLGLQLELVPPGAIAGRLAHEPSDEVFVRLVPADTGWSSPVRSWTGRPDGHYGMNYPRDFADPAEAYGLGPRGEFRLERLPSGTYDLGIFLPFTKEPVAAVYGLVVPEFGECKDSRLKRIELLP
jgi:hypothetical protein